MKFSVIVPVRSINDYLKENIEHIKKLSYRDYEVLIILDSSEKYDFNDRRFRVLSAGSVSPGEKRNVGVRNASGEILAFLDDDAYPSVGWLSEAARIFEDKSVFALGAPDLTPQDASFLEKCSGRVLESCLTSGNTVFRHVPVKRRLINDYPTVNLFVRKDAFISVGGFTREFWPGEDTKLCLDLVKKYGRKFLYDPMPVVFHHRRKLFIPHLKQISRYGWHRGQFVRIFPENSRSIFYFIPSLFIVGLVVGFILSMFREFFWPLYLAFVGLYLVILVYEMAKVCFRDKSLKESLYVGAGIFLTNFVYGINFIIGFLKRPRLKLKRIDPETGSYVEG